MTQFALLEAEFPDVFALVREADEDNLNPWGQCLA